jgi:hypothetical protein
MISGRLSSIVGHLGLIKDFDIHNIPFSDI